MFSYYIFHKPYQVLSQFSREGDKQTLAHFFKGLPKNVYPVGRLDYDSEGLLLLTDDKALTHQLLDPMHGHTRTYLVQVEGSITDEAIKKLSGGVDIRLDGKQYHTKKAGAEIVDEPAVHDRNPPVRFRRHIPTSWIQLTLTEGKNRQVRRMTAAVGFPTLRLIRYAIGAVTLGAIPPGSYSALQESSKHLLLARKE